MAGRWGDKARVGDTMERSLLSPSERSRVSELGQSEKGGRKNTWGVKSRSRGIARIGGGRGGRVEDNSDIWVGQQLVPGVTGVGGGEQTRAAS